MIRHRDCPIRNDRRHGPWRYRETAPPAAAARACAGAATPRAPARNAVADRGHGTRRYWPAPRSEEHTSELQSLMRIPYVVFCLKKKNKDSSHCIQILNMIHKHIMTAL